MIILETLKAVIDNFGSAIVVPFIIFIIALIFRVKPAKAFLSCYTPEYLWKVLH